APISPSGRRCCAPWAGSTRRSGPARPPAAGRSSTGSSRPPWPGTVVPPGGFAGAPGPGAPAGGGGDLAVFVRTILAGHVIAYEPAAIVWHEHRDEPGQLRRQLFNYGVGLAAFATKYLSDRRTARDILIRLPGGLRHLRSIVKRAERPAELPRTVVTAELLGLAWGPMAYCPGRQGPPTRHGCE